MRALKHKNNIKRRPLTNLDMQNKWKIDLVQFVPKEEPIFIPNHDIVLTLLKDNILLHSYISKIVWVLDQNSKISKFKTFLNPKL
jgi:hypothetical protein